MVKVVFYKSGNNYYGFHEYGDAGFYEAGKDIVCAALSAMTMLIINTIEVVWGANVDFEMDEKTADISVKVKSALPAYEEDEAKQYAVQGLIYSYYLQLSEMLEDYYDYLDVDCIEQDIEKD